MFKATISIEIQDNIEKKINVFNHYGVAIFTLFFLGKEMSVDSNGVLKSQLRNYDTAPSTSVSKFTSLLQTFIIYCLHCYYCLDWLLFLFHCSFIL